MKIYIGIILTIIGALLLIASYFIPGAVDNNLCTVGPLAIIIIGLVTHIMVNKKEVEQ